MIHHQVALFLSTQRLHREQIQTEQTFIVPESTVQSQKQDVVYLELTAACSES